MVREFFYILMIFINLLYLLCYLLHDKYLEIFYGFWKANVFSIKGGIAFYIKLLDQAFNFVFYNRKMTSPHYL